MKKFTKLAAIISAAALLFGMTACSSDSGDDSPKKVAVQEIQFASTSKSVEKTGTVTNIFTVLPENATNKEVVWSVADDTVASVADDGMVTGKKPGSTKVTATAKDGSGVTAEYDLEVTNYIWKINEKETDKGFVSAVNKDGVELTVQSSTKNIGDTKYEGKGFLDNPALIVYHVKSPSAQNAKVSVRYAHWGWTYQVKVGYISVNGVDYLEPSQLLYMNQKGKMLVSSNEVIIPLNAGDNQIRFLPLAKGTTVTKYTEALGYGLIYPNGETDEASAVTAAAAGNVAGPYLADGLLANIDYIKFETEDAKLEKGSENTPSYYVVKATAENGTIEVSPAKASYEAGTTVTVTATPAAGYVFDSWCGSTTETAATFTVTLDSNKSYTPRFIPASFNKATEIAGLEGYASVCDDDGSSYTVTGGFGGEEITISTFADLETYHSKITGSDPVIINVAARITTADNVSTTFDIGSNKTLQGVAGQDYGFKNINPKVLGSNVIIKYLHFGDVIGDDLWGGSGNDALSIKGGQHVWIDHCEFSSSLTPKNNDGTDIVFADYIAAGGHVDLEGENTTEEIKWAKDFYDGLLDISETSRFVSISNSYFHDHWKACLCGGSNDNNQKPQGELVRLTMYNNYFENIHARQPLFRYGKAHIYSSYIKGVSDTNNAGELVATGIEVRALSQVYVDHVYFESIRPERTVGCWNGSSGYEGGTWVVEDCEGTPVTSTETSYVPPYQWTKTSAADSKANLPSSAGNR